MVTRSNGTRSQGGFYLMVVVMLGFAVAVMVAALTRLWEAELVRDRERDLIWVGREFTRALTSYRGFTPPGQPPAPGSIGDLLLDRRVDPPLRHLRRAYSDPVTGKAQWGIEQDANGRIVGIHSLSLQHPRKPDGYWPDDPGLAAVARYADRVFRADPMTIVPRAIVAPPSEGG